jgi:Tol biopolymer transport system component
MMSAMTLAPGTRLGPYEIVSRLGAGGMGEVFRARDTRLDRSVAVKVLPPEFARNAQLRARFEREAKTISQLNHPHVCTLHDVGSVNGISYLVMELVDGESLAERLTRGAMPLPDVLRYGAQIADALDRAHRAGVVHRDLKPGNIMITKSGAKLLDFGLARSAQPHNDPDAPTQQHPVTSEGMIIGTLPYMAPEQLQGGDVDARADLFSFGAVLYEMVTGRRAFNAANSASLIAAILEHHPPRPSEVQRVTPPLLEHVIVTCLAKDRDERHQCAADVAHQLRYIASGGAVAAVEAAKPAARGRSTRLLAVAAALGLLAVAAAAMTAYRFGAKSNAAPRAEFTQLTFSSGDEREPTISPDGTTFAYVKTVDGKRDIFLQRIDGTTAINLTNTRDVDDSEPAFSPDGSRIVFRSERDGGGLFVMGATGESVRRLTDSGYNPSWSPDGRSVIYSAQRLVEPIFVYGIRNMFVVDVETGATKLLHDGLDVLQPRWSPGGNRVTYWSPNRGTRDIHTIDKSGDAKSVQNLTNDHATDWNPVWSRDGKFVYFSSDRDGAMNIWRVPVDEKSGAATGAPQSMRTPALYAGYFSMAADDRHVVYQANAANVELLQIDFDPATERVTTKPDPLLSGSMHIRYPAASPDGKWVAFTAISPQEDVFIVASDGSGMRQLTDDLFRDRGLVWSPDSTRILFYSTRVAAGQTATNGAVGGDYNVWSIRPDGSGLTQLTSVEGGVNFPRISPDQKRIAFIGDKEHGGISSLGTLPVRRAEEPFPPTATGRFSPRGWSPNGEWIVGGTYGSTDLLVYSPRTKKLSALDVAARAAAFVDDVRILFVDTNNRIGVVDINNRQIRYVGALPHDPRRPVEWSSFGMSGRSIIACARRVESDIWLMKLIDE